MIPIVVVGAGGFGREVVDVVRAHNAAGSVDSFDLVGVVDAGPTPASLELLASMDVPFLGSEVEWLRRGMRAQYVVGIGNPAVRKQIAAAFDAQGFEAATLIHPAATLGSGASVGVGAVVCAGVQVSSNVTLGRHVHINPNATVGHDARLAEFVSVNPGAILSGNVTCQSEALVGAGAIVLQGLTVGRQTVVGAGACVTRSIPAQKVAVGVPARWV